MRQTEFLCSRGASTRIALNYCLQQDLYRHAFRIVDRQNAWSLLLLSATTQASDGPRPYLAYHSILTSCADFNY